jgi:adenylate cyclase
MTDASVKRKLTAILSADVEGYSRLMGADEAGTVRTLESYRKLIAALIQQHRGRVVDATGDNLLAEFVSVVDAVQCAVEIQEVIRSKNADMPVDLRMEFRIGINLGDVIEEGDKIYGDGVNIAARIESLAEGGGICISGSAYEQIENKLALGYEYLGKHTVKNILKPIQVYRVPMGSRVGALKKKKTAKVGIFMGAIGATVLVLLAGLAVWHFFLRTDHAPMDLAPKEKIPATLDKKVMAELVFWESIKDSENKSTFEEYLRHFPNGLFAGLAKINIQKLSKIESAPKVDSGLQKDPERSAPTKAKPGKMPAKKHHETSKEKASAKEASGENYEIIFWQSIQDSNNIAVFQEYLRRFPKGAFAGLAIIRIKDLSKVESQKPKISPKPKGQEVAKISPSSGKDAKPDSRPYTVDAKKSAGGEVDKSEKRVSSLPPQQRVDKPAKDKPVSVEVYKTDHQVDIAIFPLRFDIKMPSTWLRRPEKGMKADTLDGLKQVLTGNKIFIPKFSYYDLGEAFNLKNIRGNILTDDIVDNLWTKKGFLSGKELDIDLITKLGRQMPVDVILLYHLFFSGRGSEAQAYLINTSTRQIHSKKQKGVDVLTLTNDTKHLTRKLFIKYVSKNFQSHPNFEIIYWETIKDSESVKIFQEYLGKFPNGTYAGLARIQLNRLSGGDF